MSVALEAVEAVAAFGSRASVIVAGDGPAGDPAQAAALSCRRLLHWHAQFSRFDPASELARLNADPRPTVPASAVMRRLVEAIVEGARLSGGLVDGTLVGEIECAGYTRSLDGGELPLWDALARAPRRRPAAASPLADWRAIRVDHRAGTVTRPPHVRFDSGGIAKGLFADILAAALEHHDAFAVDCAGDLRVGGAAGLRRAVAVASPFEDAVLDTFEMSRGAAATSGIGRRSWLDHAGRPAHHLLDPASGRPAYTGIVQATALAPTAVEAEVRAKAALLGGPAAARAALPHGGLVVYDDGSFARL